MTTTVSASPSTTTTAVSSTASGEAATIDALGLAVGRMMWENRPPGEPLFGYNEERAECIGLVVVEGLVASIGYESIVEAGVTPGAVRDGSASLAELISNEKFDLLLLDGFVECQDLVAAMAGEIAQRGGLSEASALCLVDTLVTDERTRQVVASGIFTVGDLGPVLPYIDETTFEEILTSCLSEDEIASLDG